MTDKKQWNEMNRKEKKTVVIVLAVVGAALVAIIAASMGGGSKAEDKTASAEYEASITSYGVIDPATLRVSVNVKNISDVEGTPRCTVHASNSSGTYKGFDVFNLGRTVSPGNEDSFNGHLTITNEGASYVTDVTASCS